MELLLSALQQSLLFLPLTLGVFLSYRILAVTDLTVDGTFVLGAATFAHFVTQGTNQYLSAVLAVLAGSVVGMLVAVMQKVVKINSLIAGILATFMLYSVNFKVMGQPNISLLDSNTVFGNINAIIIFIIILCILLCIFLHSRIGLLLRGYGSNAKLLRRMGKSTLLLLILGLAISNGLAALCGVINAQVDGYADLNMGLGMALTAIGAVVIGSHLVSRLIYRGTKFNAIVACFSCIFGTFLYFLLMNIFLFLGINPIYLKLVLGIVLICFLGAAKYSHKTYICEEYNNA